MKLIQRQGRQNGRDAVVRMRGNALKGVKCVMGIETVDRIALGKAGVLG